MGDDYFYTHAELSEWAQQLLEEINAGRDAKLAFLDLKQLIDMKNPKP